MDLVLLSSKGVIVRFSRSRAPLSSFLGFALVLGFSACAFAARVRTNPLNNDPLVRQAYDRFYNLDYPQAVQLFERLRATHPGDPQAAALLLNALVFQELYRLDMLDTTFYATDGFLTGRHATAEDSRAHEQIIGLADQAVQEADGRLARNPRDLDALYSRAWARSLKCTYLAMVERAYGAGFRLATKARDDDARVLELDPNYVDAKLVVGIYDYVVGALPWPFKLLIGFAGITGSKAHGLQMLNDVANRGDIARVEARTVIALFLRREARYKEAIDVMVGLRNDFPHGFLFCLEEANLRKDDGEGMRAVEVYRQVLANAARPGYFSNARIELAYFGYGEALRGQRHYVEAAQAYERGAFTPGVGPELKIRSLVAAGECHDVVGQRQQAIHDYQAAIEAGPQTSRADSARHHLRSPYRGN